MDYKQLGEIEEGFLNTRKLLGVFEQVINLSSPVLWENSFGGSVQMDGEGKTEGQEAS